MDPTDFAIKGFYCSNRRTGGLTTLPHGVVTCFLGGELAIVLTENFNFDKIILAREVLLYLPAKVSALGLIPAKRFDVPKSEIFSTPL